MIKRDSIGIIGLGFVGEAIYRSFDHAFTDQVLIDPAKGYKDSYQNLAETAGVFVCVPSPMSQDGSCDTSILESVLDNLKNVNYTGVIISKCTAPPTVYTRLQKEFPNLVHVPEFLTAANALNDYLNGTFAFIGGEVSAYRNEAERLIKISQRELKQVYHCSIAEASLAKYTINSFLATKVVFMNELYQLANAVGCDYNTIARMVSADDRIGRSHMVVPGPDGSFGFGGMCFPKDTSALLKFAESLGQNLNTLEAAVKKNTLLRLTEPK
jgi:UDPglucose 6-dehydrogenase